METGRLLQHGKAPGRRRGQNVRKITQKCDLPSRHFRHKLPQAPSAATQEDCCATNDGVVIARILLVFGSIAGRKYCCRCCCYGPKTGTIATVQLPFCSQIQHRGSSSSSSNSSNSSSENSDEDVSNDVADLDNDERRVVVLNRDARKKRRVLYYHHTFEGRYINQAGHFQK